MLIRLRPAFVLIHRWVGLSLAGFLLVAGLTGALLAWHDELESAISPHLFVVTPPAGDALALDPLVLRALVAARHPDALTLYAPLRPPKGRSLRFYLVAQPGHGGHAPASLPNDEVFVNPYTGQILGERKWGDITQGMKNLIPFVYRLHYQLAIGVIGTYAFGLVALLWTLDCFVGAYLTFPVRMRRREGASANARGKGWMARWWPAWKVRWDGSRYKVNVDLHRAVGLWLWAMLFILAWSAVSFNLPEVYNPVMRLVSEHQPDDASLPNRVSPLLTPAIDWSSARQIGQRLMAQHARAHDFVVRYEEALAFDPIHGVYRYDVQSSRDIRDRRGKTSLAFDADTGAFKGLWLPTGAASGDTIREWLAGLHMAALWGVPMKIFLCLIGLAVSLLSVTGVVIWERKHGARHRPSIRMTQR